MARIVVFFGTTDGQTAKIVRHLAEVLRSGHDTVDVFDTRAPIASGVFRGVDAAIIAGSVRMGKFQRALVAFLRQHREVLERLERPCARLRHRPGHEQHDRHRDRKDQRERADELGDVGGGTSLFHLRLLDRFPCSRKSAPRPKAGAV